VVIKLWPKSHKIGNFPVTLEPETLESQSHSKDLDFRLILLFSHFERCEKRTN